MDHRTLPRTWAAAAHLARSLGLLCCCSVSLAQDASSLALEFNEDFLMRDRNGPRVDLSRFRQGNPVQPGTYRSDIFINGTWLVRADVLIKADGAATTGYACLAKSLVYRLGIDPAALTAPARRMMGLNPPADATEPDAASDAAPDCLALDAIVEGGTSRYDVSEQRLDLTVPQALISRRTRGYVDPESWDYGVNAGLLNYRFSSYQSDAGGSRVSQSFLGLNAGINLGGWQLRHDGNLVNNDSTGTAYQSINLVLRHDVVDLRSTFLLGDAYTDGQFFESYGLRGVTLASDDRMLPESLRGFAPTIRGQAFSQANVQVRQNGTLLLETSVPPGPFIINDLYPTGFGGDLEVTVVESDGSRRVSLVPFSSSPQLMRDGGYRYSLSGGLYRQSAQDRSVVQGQFQYGLSNTLTLEGGLSATADYQALLLGGALNTPLGALSLDYTRSQFSPPGLPSLSGDSWRAQWSKLLETTGTSFVLAAYRFSSENFTTLASAISTLDQLATTTAVAAGNRVQSSLKLSVNQNLGTWGSLYLSGSSTEYWGFDGRSTSFQMGYARQFGRVQASVGLTRQAASLLQSENSQFFVSLNIPLEVEKGRTSSLHVTQQHDDLRGDSTQGSYAGSYGKNQEFSYGLFANHASTSDVAGGNLSYRSHFGQVGLGISSGSGTSTSTTTTTLTAEGALLLHAGGITASNTLGDTIGLVRVDGGEGIEVMGNQGAPVDSGGYSVVRYLSPYATNEVTLDMSKASLDTQLEATDQFVAPHAGAVVLMNFKPVPGYTILISGRLPTGAPLPFGAQVVDAQQQQVGAVGQGGRVEARVTQTQGTLTVIWGAGADQRCALTYEVPPDSDHQHKLVQLQALCTPAEPSTPDKSQLSLNDRHY